MSKHWKLSLHTLVLVIFLVGCFVGINLRRTSIIQDGFPLSQKWSIRVEDSVAALSVPNNKLALVRTNKSLYALDIQSGKVIWHKELSWQADPRPAIATRDMVYVVGGNTLDALHLADGSVLWQQSLYGFAGEVLAATEQIIVVKDGKGIHIYDAATGILLLDHPGCRTVMQAYINAGNIFVPCDGILRIDFSTGYTSWWKENEGIIGNVGYVDRVMYLSQAKPTIVAIDLNSWKELWSISMEIDGFESFDVYRDSVFLTDFSKLCALKQQDGTKVWCVDMSYPQKPSFIGETVYVFSGDHGEINVFELSTGKQIGELTINGFHFLSTYQQLMASSDKVLLFASGRDIFAFE